MNLTPEEEIELADFIQLKVSEGIESKMKEMQEYVDRRVSAISVATQAEKTYTGTNPLTGTTGQTWTITNLGSTTRLG